MAIFDEFRQDPPVLVNHELLVDGVSLPAEDRMTRADLELERLLAEDDEPTPGELALVDELLAERPEQ